MGLDRCGFSPRVQQKIVHAGVNSSSYQQASRDLAELSDLNVKPKPVERIVKKIGQKRIDQRDAAVAAHQRLALMDKDVVADPKRSTPQVAMASVDGGRMQIRSNPSQPRQASHWRESKVAVLETYQSAVHHADPDPDVPRCFLDLKRTQEMVRGLGHDLPVGLEFGAENRDQGQDERTPKGQDRRPRPGRPKRLVRSVLASRRCRRLRPDRASGGLGGDGRNFFGAARKAFLGPGGVNWTVQRHFASFTPILDFVHAARLRVRQRRSRDARKARGGALPATDSSRLVGPGGDDLDRTGSPLCVPGAPPSECADSDPQEAGLRVVALPEGTTPTACEVGDYRRQGLPRS